MPVQRIGSIGSLAFAIVISLIGTTSGLLPLYADDWPQWRGPERTGVSQETGLADSWPEVGPPVIWEADFLGEGYGAVSRVGERVYVQGTEDGKSLVFALDVQDGSLVWKTALGPRLVQDQGNGPRSTPTVVGDVLYVLNGMGELAELAAEDGSTRWQFNMLDRFGAENIRWGISESPLVEGDRLYIMPGGPGATVVALDRSTGDTIWTSSELSDGASYSSLIVADVGDIHALVGFTRKAGVGVRADDGTPLWSYEAPANTTANAATPIFANGLAFYTSSYGVGGGAVRVRQRGDEVEAQEAYFAPNLQNHHGGAVLHEGNLYAFFGNALVCADFETGQVRWRNRSVGKGSLTLADGKLFLVGERYRVGLAEATPEEYRQGGRFEIADHGPPSWAHPVVSGGRLYLRNQHTLTAYDVAAGESTRAESSSGAVR